MTRRAHGLTLVEVVFAGAILVVGIMTALLLTETGTKNLHRSKEVEIARLAVQQAREALAAVRFRAATSADVTGTTPQQWLFSGGYPIARNADESRFNMPDRRTTTLVTDNGIGGCVVVEFPVPPLRGVPPATHAGKIVFYVNETTQPTAIPTTAFPFPPTAGLTKLDCDGDGLLTTTNLRAQHSAATNPYRLIPVKISVTWRGGFGNSLNYKPEVYEEHHLLSYQGFN